MFKRKSVFSVVLFVLFLVCFSGVVNAENIDLKSVIEKREKFGIQSDEKTVKNLIKNGQLSESYGIYLSVEEEEEFKSRLEKYDKSVEAWENYSEKNAEYNEIYVDMYVEHRENTLVHLIFERKLSEEEEKHVLSFFDNAVIEVGSFSVEELGQEIEKVKEELKEEKVNFTIYEDLPNQKIVVETNVKNVEKVKKVKENISSRKIEKEIEVEVKGTNKEEVQEPYSRSAYTRPLVSGLVVDKQYIKDICSLGFPALKDNKVYFITAGHCFNISEGVFQGGEYIGHFSFKQLGGSADAGAIYIGSRDVSSNAYGHPFKIDTVEVAGNDKLGDVVCKNGMHGVSCGEIVKINFTNTYFDVDNNLYYTVSNMRLADFYATYGDSGAIVYHSDKLKGIVTGPGKIAGDTKLYAAYSHVSHVSAALGVTPITWK